MSDAEGHLALQNAKATEAGHLATTQQQIAEWDMSIRQHEANIKTYQDGIESERASIRQAKEERAKLRRKRRIFQYAVFQLDQVDQQ